MCVNICVNICVHIYIYVYIYIYIYMCTYIYLSEFGHRVTSGRLITFKLKKLGNRATGRLYRHSLNLEENY